MWTGSFPLLPLLNKVKHHYYYYYHYRRNCHHFTNVNLAKLHHDFIAWFLRDILVFVSARTQSAERLVLFGVEKTTGCPSATPKILALAEYENCSGKFRLIRTKNGCPLEERPLLLACTALSVQAAKARNQSSVEKVVCALLKAREKQ